MKTKTSHIVLLLATLTLLGLPIESQAQTDIVTTTITEPITSTATGGVTITLASATGISDGIFILIDNEVMRVSNSWTSGTAVPVLRPGRPTTHADNALVWIFPQAATVTRDPAGSCTRGSGEASHTLTLVYYVGHGTIGACRQGSTTAIGGVAANTTWYITDISGVRGAPSPNPPETQ